MMLSGEHPDTEVDKLLESFGVQVNQIGLIPINNFFKGQQITEALGDELREKIDEIRLIYKNWSTVKITDVTRKNFLAKLSELADFLGVSLAVEHLLPGLLDLV